MTTGVSAWWRWSCLARVQNSATRCWKLTAGSIWRTSRCPNSCCSVTLCLETPPARSSSASYVRPMPVVPESGTIRRRAMSLANAMADFVHGLDIETLPAEVVEKARACVLNGYGIALGSHATPFFPVAAEAALAMDGECAQGATLLRDGRKSTVAGATLANAALFHGRAQE